MDAAITVDTVDAEETAMHLMDLHGLRPRLPREATEEYVDGQTVAKAMEERGSGALAVVPALEELSTGTALQPTPASPMASAIATMWTS